jgi:hypothetical protein
MLVLSPPARPDAPPEPAAVTAAPDESEATDAPPSPPAPVYVALVKIFAGSRGVFDKGDAIPESVARDGLSEHLHWTRE